MLCAGPCTCFWAFWVFIGYILLVTIQQTFQNLFLKHKKNNLIASTIDKCIGDRLPRLDRFSVGHAMVLHHVVTLRHRVCCVRVRV